jgi:D-alanine-D-alanine ligase-like ATP-grasp enzyme
VDAVLTDNNKLYVIDVNPIPNLALHQFPLYGSSVLAGLEVLKALFEDLALERGS